MADNGKLYVLFGEEDIDGVNGPIVGTRKFIYENLAQCQEEAPDLVYFVAELGDILKYEFERKLVSSVIRAGDIILLVEEEDDNARMDEGQSDSEVGTEELGEDEEHEDA